MKALTLTQPWATLVAIGAKQVETRSWKTNYRGPIAIHAAKGFPGWAKTLCQEEPFSFFLRTALGDGGFAAGFDPKQLPLGAVLATATITDCQLTADVTKRISLQERLLGDYSAGRYAWFLSDVKVFYPPILAKGAQSLWRWENPFA